MLKYYEENSFSDNVFHGFFTRLGGVSSYPYAGLNCGIGSKDSKELVHENRGLVAVQAASEALLSLYQMHGTKVIKINEPWKEHERPQADGFVTDKSGIALGILTADCAPVLFYGKKSDNIPVIGAAHAGWGGALNGVLENTVGAMKELGALDIKACIGPCISQLSYEVDVWFMDKFIDESEESSQFFKNASKQGHVMFDLSGYCAWRLSRTGIENISSLDIDTYENEEEFFSYRRSTHKNEKDYGRQISVICINP